MIRRAAILALAAHASSLTTPAFAQVDTVVHGRDTVIVGPTRTCKPPPLALDLRFFRPSDTVGVPEQDVRGAAHYAIFTGGYVPAAWTPGVTDTLAHVRLEVDLWVNGGYRVQASLLPPGTSRASRSGGSKGTIGSSTELGAIIYSYVQRAISPLGRPPCQPLGPPP